MPDWQRDLLTDPQTSGGLLIACEADKADAIAERMVKAGYPASRVVGFTVAGEPRIEVHG